MSASVSPSRSGYENENTNSLSNFTDDDDVRPQTIEPLLSRNNVLSNYFSTGLEFLSDQKFDEAAKTYRAALSFVGQMKDNSRQVSQLKTVFHTNLAVACLFMGQLADAEKSLNEALQALNYSSSNKSELSTLLYFKVMTTFCALYIKIEHFDNVQWIIKMTGDIIRAEKNASLRSQMVSQLVYLYFRTDSLVHFLSERNSELIKAEQKLFFQGIDDLMTGFQFQFSGEKEKAGESFFKSLDVWRAAGDDRMILIVLKYIRSLFLEHPAALGKVESYYRAQLEASRTTEEALSEVFAAFEVKVQILKELFLDLKALEQFNPTAKSNPYRKLELEFSKIAVKLALRNNLHAGRELLRVTPEQAKAQLISESLANMERVLGLIEKDPSLTVIQSMSSDPFVISSSAKLKSSVNTISSVLRQELKRSFDAISIFAGLRRNQARTFQPAGPGSFPPQFGMNGIQSNRVVQPPGLVPPMPGVKVDPFNQPQSSYRSLPNYGNPTSRKPIPSKTPMNMSLNLGSMPPIASISRRAREAVLVGDTLTKLNYTSSGTLQKFFKVFNNTTLRWGKKPSDLLNLRNSHSYHFKDIRGIIYGKCTNTFKKSSGRSMEQWLCFSLILHKRPLDVYAEEDQINLWYIGLSELLKIHNPNSFALNKGQFFWRKMIFLMRFAVFERVPDSLKKNSKSSLSAVKIIRLYGLITKAARTGVATPRNAPASQSFVQNPANETSMMRVPPLIPPKKLNSFDRTGMNMLVSEEYRGQSREEPAYQ